MAKVFIEETTLTAIGDAIRSKTGKTELIDPAVMSTEIESISGGGSPLPENASIITGDCTCRLAYNGWNWYVDAFKDKLTTRNLTNIQSMFYSSNKLLEFPTDLNFGKGGNPFFLNQTFSYSGLETLPRINIPEDFDISVNGINLEMALQSTANLRDAENLFSAETMDRIANWELTDSWKFAMQCLFSSCISLRKVPSWYYKLPPSIDSPCWPEGWQCAYNFQNCYVLDEVTNLPVWRNNNGACYDSSLFLDTYSFEYCGRLKNVTFETKADGTPYEANWSNQVINLREVGRLTGQDISRSGITKDKEVSDDDSYARLKNDPDWYTNFGSYSRYNHDSAVATINSLPDTSAYLTQISGEPNSILFRTGWGSNTDGGGVEDLTEAEIAVAAAKGWTVSIQ